MDTGSQSSFRSARGICSIAVYAAINGCAITPHTAPVVPYPSPLLQLQKPGLKEIGWSPYAMQVTGGKQIKGGVTLRCGCMADFFSGDPIFLKDYTESKHAEPNGNIRDEIRLGDFVIDITLPKMPDKFRNMTVPASVKVVNLVDDKVTNGICAVDETGTGIYAAFCQKYPSAKYGATSAESDALDKIELNNAKFEVKLMEGMCPAAPSLASRFKRRYASRAVLLSRVAALADIIRKLTGYDSPYVPKERFPGRHLFKWEVKPR